MAPRTVSGLAARVRTLGNQHARHGGLVDRAAGLARRPLDRALLGRQARFAQLRALGREALVARPPARAEAPRVLVLALRGWISHSAYEFTIAQALRLRGAEVGLLTCGGGQPACEMGWARNMLPRPCDRCAWFTDTFAGAAQLPAYRLVDHIPWGGDTGRAPARPMLHDGGGGGGERGAIATDPYAASAISVPWFLRTTRPTRVPEGAQAIEDFAVAAQAVEAAAAAVLDEFAPDVVFMVNGLFAAEQVIRGVALARGLRAPTYEMAPRADTLVFSQDAPAPDYDTGAVWARVRGRRLTAEQDAAVAELLGDRARGVGAHERYFDVTEDDQVQLRRRLRIPAGARVVSLFTNLSWDSATIGHDIGYASMFDWIERTVRSCGEIDDLVLVVRIHPAEARWGTREEVEAEVLGALGEIPANVRFVAATEALSSYALLGMSDLVLGYTTTVGLEAAFRGVPVAVAGDTHYRGRGFTLDVEDHVQLERALRDADGRMDPAHVELARRYAYTFFFRSMIPFPSVRAEGALTHEIASSIAQLAPGADPFLDWICDRILDGGEFTLPDELAGRAPRG
jgi:hypothetical protein